jgi:hypothetical protein
VRTDDYEEDSRERPVPCEPGVDWMTRTLHSSADEDWFAITVNKDGLLVLETDVHTRDSGEVDTIMYLYKDGSAGVLDENDDSGDGMASRIEYYAKNGDRYIVKIRELDNHTGSYRFRASFEESGELIDAAIEPNDSRRQATPLEFAASPIQAAFSGASDRDWYKFTIPAGGGRITVYTEGAQDTLMTLYDADGEELTDDDDSGKDNNAKITFNVPEGAVYIKVSDYDHARGRYSLHFSFEGTSPRARPDA